MAPKRKACPVIPPFSLPPHSDGGSHGFGLTHRPAEFYVVGERRDNPLNLLLRDPDGNFYACLLPDGEPISVEPDETWHLEPQALEVSTLEP